ncbi:MAG: hypothetical protein QE271_07410 [Bacteriovoracaceae bacterium]|nr:hypothetical protein [Bacteriovoracaceae bacterium]
MKLKKFGNSYGFSIPSIELKNNKFKVSDDFEMITNHNSITFTKRRPHNKNWKFKDAKLSKADREWLEANMGNLDE